MSSEDNLLYLPPEHRVAPPRRRTHRLSRLRALFAIALWIPMLEAAPPAPGTPFPPLADFALEGTVPELDGARVVIVDFWASWCAPCRQSFPVYSELQREFGPRGLVIVAVSVDTKPELMRAFVQRHQPAFAVVRDAGQQLATAVEVPAMPTAFVLDHRGIVRFVHHGFRGARSRRAYLEQIQILLEEQP